MFDMHMVSRLTRGVLWAMTSPRMQWEPSVQRLVNIPLATRSRFTRIVVGGKRVYPRKRPAKSIIMREGGKQRIDRPP